MDFLEKTFNGPNCNYLTIGRPTGFEPWSFLDMAVKIMNSVFNSNTSVLLMQCSPAP